MPETTERSLPISSGHREFTVRAGGQDLPRTEQLMACSITLQANHIAWARLVWLDGSASAGQFALTDGDRFAPGQAIEVSAGAQDDRQLLFKGVVVRQQIRVRGDSPAQLIVECRAAPMTLAQQARQAVWRDQTDAELLRSLLGACGDTVEVEDTAARHEQLVQTGCSDWDFALARARANGLVVLPRPGALKLARPGTQGEPVLQLQYGATLLELDLEVDARVQPAGIAVPHWSAPDQALQTAAAQAPTETGGGSHDPASLARVHGNPARPLPHSTLSADEAQALGDGLWARARADKLCGRALCEGLGQVHPGDVVTLSGTGARFGGRLQVSGVRHDMDSTSGWRTHLQFGGLGEDQALDQRLQTPPRPALLAPVQGLQLGVVTSLEDPLGEDRVRVRLPLIEPDGEGVWARVARPEAGPQRGFVFRPELDDEVVLGFLDNDPRHPVLLGALHSSQRAAPEPAADANPARVYRSREGLEMRFDDEHQAITLSTPGGRQLVLSDDEGAISLKDQAGNELRLDDDGITLKSAAATTLETTTSLTQQVNGDFTLKVSGQLKLEGTAGAELRSSALTVLAGSLLQLN
ncbi:type VI secretion system tip protein VgrG [Ideonella alba]|uniref:Type VI secretion system tip protein VgrG n=1 Tax=Ideonella alba TaxID=2824118 RepID=A0A941BG32_9BURK|nr:type VI secretion system tip protein VgrG [Ideonella alba]MBQ0930063.1 type VI secretion system tip protein VgrG [Ideonella alba]